MNNETRRSLLKGLALTLPVAWTRPVVESVVLPAHAQASSEPMVLMFGGTGLVPVEESASIDNGIPVAQWTHKVLNAVVPVSEAAPSSLTVCATLNGNMLTITTQGSNNHGRHMGTLNTNGTPGTLALIVNTCTQSNDFDAYVSGFSAASGFTLNLTGGSAPFHIFVPLVTACPGFASLSCPP